MANIIINADDFGYSDGICRSIIELFDADAITGTSLMIAAFGAAERFQSWHVSNLLGRAGVHLQLTVGKPISPAADVGTLIDPQSGHFRDPRSGDLPAVSEVETEWRRQLDVAHDVLGGSPTHLDSHHGVHRIPEFFEVYVKLASELGIPVRGFGGEIGKKMHAEGIRGSVALVRDWTGRSLGAKALRAMVTSVIAENPKESVIEVVSHPGYNDEYLSSVSRLSAPREDDHKALLQLAREGWPEDEGHKLVPHAQLAAA